MPTLHVVETIRGLSHHVVAVVLLYSGIQKAIGLRTFRRELLFIPYMRVSWSYVIGYALPFVEIGLAAALILGLRIATFGAIALFATFALVAGLALRKRLAVPCNCFGTGGKRVLSRETIALNVVLIVLTVMGTRASSAWELVSLLVATSIVLLVPTLFALRDVLKTARESRWVA